MSPLFTVVIPTYNRADLIGKTLDTVFAQKFQDFEVVVVDNCSTDNTPEVIAPYEKSGKLRFIQHDRNYERARSRNTGMENARGEFVTFLDSDDLMYPENLKDAAEFIRTHPQSRFFHNLYELVDPSGRRLHRYRFPSMRNPIRAIAEGNFLSCIGVFIHREIYSRYRFDTDPDISGSEDWAFWLSVVATNTPERIEKVNSGIVEHGGRTVNLQDVQRAEVQARRVLAGLWADPSLSATYGPYRIFMEASRALFLAGIATRSGDRKKALLLLWDAARRHPRLVPTWRFVRTLQLAVTPLVYRQNSMSAGRA